MSEGRKGCRRLMREGLETRIGVIVCGVRISARFASVGNASAWRNVVRIVGTDLPALRLPLACPAGPPPTLPAAPRRIGIPARRMACLRGRRGSP